MLEFHATKTLMVVEQVRFFSVQLLRKKTQVFATSLATTGVE
jgi:hypothetical protein